MTARALAYDVVRLALKCGENPTDIAASLDRIGEHASARLVRQEAAFRVDVDARGFAVAIEDDWTLELA